MLSPGYSYDTAYVEFLNLEDAVRFMESNKVAHPRHYEGPLSQQDFGRLRRLLVERGGGGDGVLSKGWLLFTVVIWQQYLEI